MSQEPRLVFTPDLQEEFFEVLKECGQIGEAITRVGVSRRQYNYVKAESADWEDRVEECLGEAVSVARDTAFERGVRGWEEPVFYKGDVCGHVRKYSDQCLFRWLERTDPRWRRNQMIDVRAQKPAVIAMTARTSDPAEFAAMEDADREAEQASKVVELAMVERIRSMNAEERAALMDQVDEGDGNDRAEE